MITLAGCAAQPLAPDTAPPQPAGAAAPPEPPGTEVASATEREPDATGTHVVDDEVVCRYVKSTGSNIREKQCFTRKELAEMSAASREFLRTRGARGAAYKPPDPEDPRAGKKD